MTELEFEDLFDRGQLDCEFEEVPWDQVTTNYSFDIDSLEDLEEDEKIEVVRAYLEDKTSVVGLTSTGSFVYVQF